MKGFVIVFACFVAVQAITSEQKELMIELGKKCIEETGVKVELVEKVRAGDYSSTDPTLKPFSACMIKKMGLVDASGNFDKDAAIAMSEEHEKKSVGEALDTCLAKITFNDDNAYEFCKCYHTIKPDHILI